MKKIGQDNIQAVFQSCKPVLKKDPGCAQFLLPYILSHVICQNRQEDLDEIIVEVEAIVGGQESFAQVATLNGTILSEQSQHSGAQDLSWMAKQTIFAVLDHMNKWMRKKLCTLTAAARRNQELDFDPSKDTEYKAVEQFVQRIQQHNLALASFECRAYARSLLHLEAHLRMQPTDLEPCMTKLQQVKLDHLYSFRIT